MLFIISFGYAQLPLPKANRILSIDITMADGNDFDKAFEIAKEAGMQATNLSITWDEFETSPNSFEPETNYLELANDYYPAKNTKISLMLGFIDSNNLRLPSDLKNEKLDSPILIKRFEAFIDYAMSQVADLELSSLAINNEIDIFLGENETLWQQYSNFYQKISKYLRLNYPDIKFGSKITYDGLLGFAKEQAKALNTFSDLIMLTYYPIKEDFSVRDPKEVAIDFANIVKQYPDKEIYILEAGYPSSSILASSEEKQAEFVKEVFKAWDIQVEHIKLIDFLWLHDLPPEALTYYGRYYGLDSKLFLAFIGSLGLRTFNGEDKPAFKMLLSEAKARAW